MPLTLLADPPNNPLVVTQNDFFIVDVVVAASSSSPVDTVQVYLNFEPNVLRVSALIPLAGDDLNVLLYETTESHDNAAGHIYFAAGKLDTTQPVIAPFTLVTIEFQALKSTSASDTKVTFAPLVDPRQTKVILDGENRTGTLATLTVVVNQ